MLSQFLVTIFFSWQIFSMILRGKLTETSIKVAVCCFHNVGYLVFGMENEVMEALKELKNLKWLTMGDWYGSQTLYCEVVSSRLCSVANFLSERGNGENWTAMGKCMCIITGSICFGFMLMILQQAEVGRGKG